VNELLLDTHAWLWMAAGQPLRNSDRLNAAENEGRLCLSPISCWELGLLVARGRVVLGQPLSDWLPECLERLKVVDLTPEIAVESSFLPGSLHNDPADRLLVATARARDATLATRDGKLLDYASQGHLRVLEI